MSPLEWWEFYAAEAAHQAEMSRNPFLSNSRRMGHQASAELHYAKARLQRDEMIRLRASNRAAWDMWVEG